MSEKEEAAIGGDDVAAIKALESRISQAQSTQLDLISSLQPLVPSLIPSLSLSLSISSLFNSNRPFDPLPDPLPTPVKRKRPSQPPIHKECRPGPDQLLELERKARADELVLRSMLAVCLMESVPFEPIESVALLQKLENDKNATVAEKAALIGAGDPIVAVEAALKSMAEINGGVELGETPAARVRVLGIDRTRLLKELPESKQNEEGSERVITGVMPRPRPEMWPMRGGPPPPPRMMMMMPRGAGMGMGMGVPPMHRPPTGGSVGAGQSAGSMKVRTEEEEMKELEDILNKKSFKEMQKSKTGAELLDLIRRPTAKENAVAAKFKSKGGSQVKEYCTALTKEDCRRQTGSFIACEKVHFRRIIALHTDMNLGDCSFLDTCRHMKTCKYVHYELDNTQDVTPMMMGAAALGPPRSLRPQRAEYCSEVELGEPQWINCDIRNFRMDILGQFGVIMADPPWDIHMELPYGTMADDEMRTLNVPALQTDGLIFLWVTGRAMELGRECLEHWGYKRCEEIIWVKTNQLQRIIRTGRTGHWLNHSKEHCLVGIKGDPLVNRNIDTDVLVAEVRETSRKPDEMYPLLERISPRTRKLELFARMHNTQAGWMSLGNQLSGVRLVDEGLRARFKAAYPEVEVQPASPPRASTMEADYNNNNNNAQTRSPFVPADSKTTSSEQKPMNVEIETTS